MNTGWQTNYSIYKKYLDNISSFYQNRQDIKLFTEMLLSIAASIIFALFAIRPTLVTIAQLYKQIESKKQTLAIMDQKIQDLSQAEAIYEREKQKINTLNSAIPEQPDLETFIRQIEGIAQKNSVILTNLSINSVPLIGTATQTEENTEPETQSTPGTQNLNVSLELSGVYPTLSPFLKDLESMRRPMLPQNTAIRLNTGETSSVLSLSINGQVPYYKQ